MAIDEMDPRYRCCWGKCKATVGAMWIAAFEALLAILFLGFAIILQNQYKHWQQYYGLAFVVLPLFYFIAINMIIFAVVLAGGIYGKKRWLLIVHMLKSGVSFVLLLCLLCFVIMALVTVGTGAAAMHLAERSPSDGGNPHAKEAFVQLTIASVVAMIVVVICTGMQIWFICIVLRAYRMIRDSAAGGGVVLVHSTHPITTVLTHTTTTTTMPTTTHSSIPYHVTTYYPGGANADAHYTPMNPSYSAIPSAPPPYTENEKV